MKIKIKNEIRLNSYAILSDQIENSINLGYRRAFKHTDNPEEETIKKAIYTAIMNDLWEILIFDDNER